MSMPFQHPAHCPSGGFVTIRPGDTLYALAQRYRTTVQAILAANPGLAPNSLQVGDLVCIPSPTPGQPFPEPCPGGSTYVIQAGDNFYAIARRFHVSLDALLTANPDVHPDRLQVGQQICIPTLPAPPVTCPGPTYTVQSGDTLYHIALTLGTTVTAILAVNPGINPNALRVGQIICLPTGATLPCPSGTVYRVRPGDTLYGIARRSAITLDQLLRANPGISSSSVIHPGQSLCIPGRM